MGIEGPILNCGSCLGSNSTTGEYDRASFRSFRPFGMAHAALRGPAKNEQAMKKALKCELNDLNNQSAELAKQTEVVYKRMKQVRQSLGYADLQP